MPSRFTQYGGAAGADAALQQMVAERIAAQMEAQKQQQLQLENQMKLRQLGQGDERIGLEGRGLDLEEQRLNKPPEPKGPISMAPGSSLVDQTGRILTTTPERPVPERGPVTLGPGGALVDPNSGRIITRVPTAPAPSMGDELKEFEAKEQIKAKYGGSRPSLGAERQTLAYFNRAQKASQDIEPLEDSVSKMGLGSQAQLQYAPNFMQTQTNQAYRQAQRAFTEARLRKESGAAIPTAEYENDAKTYFAQPGDSPETLAQKRQARQVVLDGLKFASGKAYEEFYGEPNQSPARQQQAAPQGGGVTIKAIKQVR